VSSEPDLPLRQLVREDRATHRSITSPGFHALAVHRAQVALADRPGRAAACGRKVLDAINRLVIRNLYGIEIYPTTVIGRRVLIGHHVGVILGQRAVIGDDCLIRQHVTLGQFGSGTEDQPTVGRGVAFGPGSTVVGGVTIGDGAIIGAHALVLRDVPAGATMMAPPARLLPATDTPKVDAPVP
jgi:serine O-acetyltransferase